MSADCLVHVNPNGNYVCRGNTLQGKCPKIITAANLPAPVAVLQSVTGDLDEEFTPTTFVLTNGTPLILMPGTYKLDFDCALYRGTAPTTGAVSICCSESDVEMALSVLSYQKLCELSGNGVLPPPVTPATPDATQLAILEKLCDILDELQKDCAATTLCGDTLVDCDGNSLNLVCH